MSLENKTILVTGASSGIGKATAQVCARLGARVVINGRDEQRLRETFHSLEGYEHLMVAGDITEEETLKTLAAAVDAYNGVAHCAGVSLMVPAKFATRKKIDWLYEADLFAPAELIRLLIKNKKIATGGSLVVVSSITGVTRCNNGNIIYGTAKAALSTWMKFLAKELGPRHIRANSVCPGMIETPLIYSGEVDEMQLDAERERYPLKRFGKPEEVADSIAFLLSDASSYITGTDLIIDGGFSI